MRVLLAAAVAATAVVIAPASPAHAEVSLRCQQHLLQTPGTTASADVRYHRSRGEFSPCNEQEASESDGANNERSNKRDDKSRYCRKHWFC